jgi:hypothetical protein
MEHVTRSRKALKGVSLLILILLLTSLALPVRVQAKPHQQGAINAVYITDVTDVSFVVSWTTTSASNGSVVYGTEAPPGTTVTDPATNTTTHYVQVSGLSPSTTYLLEVHSGALVDNNGGNYYSVTTGPFLGPPPLGSQIVGQIFEQDATTVVENAIMYLRLQDNGGGGSPGNSQWVTARQIFQTDGFWYYTYNFGAVRTQNGLGFFAHTPGTDNLQYVAQGGDKGAVGEIGNEEVMLMPVDAEFQLDVTLDNIPNAVELTQFTASNAPANTTALWVGIGISVLALAGLVLVWKRKRA